MTDNSELQSIIAMAYRDKVLGQGDLSAALARFAGRREDPTFMEAARAELGRVTAIPNAQCYVSKVTMDFLKEALNG